MNDIFSYKEYADFKVCPFCGGEVNTAIYQILNEAICKSNCLAPLTAEFLYGVNGLYSGKLVGVRIKRDDYQIVFFFISYNQISIKRLSDDKMIATRIQVPSFNVESLKSDSWLDTIKTLLVFH